MALLKKGSNTINSIKTEGLELRKFLEKHKDNINIEITSLTVGTVLYKDPITKELYIWSDNDSKTVKLDTLFNIYSSSKGLLQSLSLAITDVFLEKELEKPITPKEISLALGLDSVYKNFDYDLANIDSYIIDSDIEAFKNVCDNCSKDINCLIAERYNYLNKEGYIADSYKERTLEETTGIKGLFDKFD